MIAKIGDRSFSLTLSPLPGNRLPKRAPSIAVSVNGSPLAAPVTSNKGWAKSADVVLEYVWITVGAKSYYLTLNYAEKAASLAGSEIVTADGSGPKPVARVGDAKREADRIAAFRATWTSRNPVVEAPKVEAKKTVKTK